MKNTILIALLIIVSVFTTLAQVPAPQTQDCIEEHAQEYRAVYALVEEDGCILDYTEYASKGDFWTAYGHLPAQEALGRK